MAAVVTSPDLMAASYTSMATCSSELAVRVIAMSVAEPGASVVFDEPLAPLLSSLPHAARTAAERTETPPI